jgi:uncharacterized membrane protein YecN with MAPEG domain
LLPVEIRSSAAADGPAGRGTLGVVLLLAVRGMCSLLLLLLSFRVRVVRVRDQSQITHANSFPHKHAALKRPRGGKGAGVNEERVASNRTSMALSDDDLLQDQGLQDVAFAEWAEWRWLLGVPLANTIIVEEMGARKFHGEVAFLETVNADDARWRVRS